MTTTTVPSKPISLQQALMLAMAHQQEGRLEDAASICRQVLAVQPDSFDALHLLGVVAHQAGAHAYAVELLSEALALRPSSAHALNNLGEAHRALKELAKAGQCFADALALDPGMVAAHCNQGAVLQSQGAFGAAIDSYHKAAELQSDCFEAINGLGAIFVAQGNLDDGLAMSRKALALRPNNAASHLQLGNAYQASGELNAAERCYLDAIALQPDFAQAMNNLGNVHRARGRLDQSISCYLDATTKNPQLVEAFRNLASAYYAQNRLPDAQAAYAKALGIDPAHAETHKALGDVLSDDENVAGAIGCYETALRLNADFAEARWALALCNLRCLCNSDRDDSEIEVLGRETISALDQWFDADRSREGHSAVGTHQPFFLSYRERDNRGLLSAYGQLCARLMAQWQRRNGLELPPKVPTSGRPRIGIVSAHIFDQSVWNALVSGWLRGFDPALLSLHVFYLGTRSDEHTDYARVRANVFVEALADLRKWVAAILESAVDVLIFPEIRMDPMTLRIASLRLAPIQISTWGHPETTGLSTIDYFLSAEDMEPPDGQNAYVEKLICLPHLGCSYRSVPTPHVDIDLGELGIDSSGPVLICPGTPFKYARSHDVVLVEIARRLGECTLVFFRLPGDGSSDRLERRLRLAFTQAGLAFDRHVVFVPWLARTAFCGLMRQADVYLDTIGFSGFNTAMQAVDCLLPIVTMEGRFMRGRLASGIMKRMGMAQLVANSVETYVTMAVRLASDTHFRKRVREQMERSRIILFDDAAPVKALEKILLDLSRPRWMA